MNRFIIYWWAKTERPKKWGHDEVELEQTTLTEDEADEILQEKAQGGYFNRKYPDLPNFEAYYPLAVHCENFGVVKVKRIDSILKATKS